MANLGEELSSIDFESMIGGPLIAVINAQAQAALSTVNFIRTVGFKKGRSEDPEATDTSEPIYVTFEYPKEVAPYQPAAEGKEAVPAQVQMMRLRVPILTMLPIPYIRVEEVTIDFNAKINSVETRQINTDIGFSADLEARQRWPSGSVRLNASFSYQKKTSEGSSVERTYSLAIHVRAVQDEIPAGMEKILGILEGAILAQPTGSPQPVTI